MRLRAPLSFLLTLSVVTRAKIIPFSQHLNYILTLSVCVYLIPTLIKNGGMIGGMKGSVIAQTFRYENQGV
ncbi:hypothetical protein BWI96_10450 [Siphonobacter sp. SORGH_AS_0500]|nr:hypothetical protein BWI96_10450 [Siphonobacter sp. SORGH_AS_0500]